MLYRILEMAAAGFVGGVIGFVLGRKTKKNQVISMDEPCDEKAEAMLIEAQMDYDGDYTPSVDFEKEMDTMKGILKNYNQNIDALKVNPDVIYQMNIPPINRVPGWFDEAEDAMPESPEDDEPDIPDGYEPDDIVHELPFVISYAAYANVKLHYNKINVRYYVPNDLFVDEGENILDDVAVALFGESIRDILRNSKDDMICIRNDKYGADYMIEIMQEDYGDEFGGL